MAGADVTLVHRGKEFARPKPENVDKLRALEKDPKADVQIERPVSERVNTAMGHNMMREMPPHAAGRVRVSLGCKLDEVREGSVLFTDGAGNKETLANDVVFAMIGREAPLDFFRRSGIPIRGEWRAATWASFLAFFALCCFVYTWKADTSVNHYFSAHKLFPFNIGSLGSGAFGKALSDAVGSPGFYYSFAYCVAIVLFGYRRDSSTENALRHAPDADADGGAGDPIIHSSVSRFPVDGERRNIRSRDIENGGR